MGRRKAEKAAARKQKNAAEKANDDLIWESVKEEYLRKSASLLYGLMERGARYSLSGDQSTDSLRWLVDKSSFKWNQMFAAKHSSRPQISTAHELAKVVEPLYLDWARPIKKNWSKARRAARRKCSFCGKVALPSEPALSTCGCMAVRYCDKTCQRAHWDAAHCEKCAVRTYDAESRAEFERLLAYHERRRPTGLEATDPMAAQHAATEASTRALAASKRATAAGKKEREAEERANKESRPEALALALKDKNAAMHQKEAAIRETLEAQRQAEAYQAAADWFA
mmetsp:Transcript_21581/g.67716  ORF Transcript_21581/g.67716 Transcript_21581/m.67716 type:complete len:283 (+) Transcript_21581:146-994(+)